MIFYKSYLNAKVCIIKKWAIINYAISRKYLVKIIQNIALFNGFVKMMLKM